MSLPIPGCVVCPMGMWSVPGGCVLSHGSCQGVCPRGRGVVHSIIHLQVVHQGGGLSQGVCLMVCPAVGGKVATLVAILEYLGWVQTLGS